VQLKAFVDVEGSGEGVTVVKGLGAAAGSIGVLVAGAESAEVRSVTLSTAQSAADSARMYMYVLQGAARLRDVTLLGTSDGGYSLIGADLISANDLILDRVKVVINGAQNETGVQLRGASESLHDVTIQMAPLTYGVGVNAVSGSTLEILGSSIVVTTNGYPTRAAVVTVGDTRIAASRLVATGAGQGVSVQAGGVVRVENSLVSGTQYAYLNQGGEVDVAYSRLDGPTVTDTNYGGTSRCLGTYGDALQPVTCQ